MSIPKRILRILPILALLYCCFVYYLYAAQDSMIFSPEKITEERWTQVAEDLQGDCVTIEVSERVGEGFGDEWEREAIHLRGWFIPDGSGEARPTIIYFGGNDERLHRLAWGGEVDLRLLDSAGHDDLMSDQAILKTVIDHLTQ